MPLVTANEVFQDAEKRGYGIGLYDTCGGQLGFIDAILKAAVEMNSPIFISDGYPALENYFGIEYFAAVVKIAAQKVKIPIVLHLDHAVKFEHIMHALRCGFTSVMFDGSRLPYDENVRLTKKVVEAAHAVGVSVEAELGKVGGLEGDTCAGNEDSSYTDPEIAKNFAEETGIDSLAPSIGTAHGFYTTEPKLDFERLARIKELTKIPLVMHGATGVPMDSIKKAIRLGIKKINYATWLKATFLKGIRRYMDEHPEDISENVLKSGRDSIKEIIKEQIKVFGSENKANAFL